MRRDFMDFYSKNTLAMEHSFIREILKVTKGVKGITSFAGGLPNPDTFPREIIAEIFNEVILNEGSDVLQYGASEGDRQLIKAIKIFESVENIGDDELIITNGSTNGIYNYTRSMIDQDDIIITEAPGFPGSIAAMEACGAKLFGIDMDELGMIPELLDKELNALLSKKKPVKFIYLIPEFQNPSGRTMSLQRRRDIIKIAKKYDIPILEDQPYRELRYSGERIITLWELARTEFNDPEIVTICKSFSKILGPGLRLGFSSGAPGIIGQMVKWSQKSIVSPDCVTQRVAAHFINRGYMHDHIKKIIELYRPKRDIMLKTLEQYMPDGVTWTKPEGGMFIWLMFDKAVNTDVLFDKAIENKIAFIPGSKFYSANNKKRNEVRLNFSYPTIDEIKKGIKILASLL